MLAYNTNGEMTEETNYLVRVIDVLTHCYQHRVLHVPYCMSYLTIYTQKTHGALKLIFTAIAVFMEVCHIGLKSDHNWCPLTEGLRIVN